MKKSFKPGPLLQALVLVLVLLGPACRASSLGMSVQVVPLDNSSGNTQVRAHFSVLAQSPCPSLSGVCAEGEDCLIHSSPVPFTGSQPAPGWCLRQWQKTVASGYRGLVTLDSKTDVYVSINAEPKVRGNSGKLNRPAAVALPPPLRARANCPHHFELAVKDPDGDRVHCRFARADRGECRNCPQHSFIELDQANCMFSFTGKAAVGQYFIHLMVEDFIPSSNGRPTLGQTPLSAVPLHLSLSVVKSSSRCSDEPVASDKTPKDKSVVYVVPYQQVTFTAGYTFQLESITEIAVTGPPQLYRVGLASKPPLKEVTVAWTRSESNQLTMLVPICFAANTDSFQSEHRCVWLYQRELSPLPAGTELTCEDEEMGLVLPLASLSSSINVTELQLSSRDCAVALNGTHLTARIDLTGCGTEIVHSGSEVVYTNTLQTVRPYTTIVREPSLILPLACRFPGVRAQGPQNAISIPSEREIFGEFRLWMEFHLPGEGPMAEFTKPTGQNVSRRAHREAGAGTLVLPDKFLDLHLRSNTSIQRAQLMVSSCQESATGDFSKTTRLLDNGCLESSSMEEITTTNQLTKIYRLNLTAIKLKGLTMYMQCVVSLCISTLPSEKCPNMCQSSQSRASVVDSVFTSSYTLKSGPISLVSTTTVAPTTTVTTTTAQTTTTNGAPKQASSLATAVILAAVAVFLLKLW